MWDRTAIEGHAVRFRNAIEAVKRDPCNRLPMGFLDFPVGSCGDASLQLATYLSDMGPDRVVYVSGVRRFGEFQSHAWVLVDGFNVDITGDQFGRPSVVVAGPEDAWFLRLWEIETRLDVRDAAFPQFAQKSMPGYAEVLSAIKAV